MKKFTVLLVAIFASLCFCMYARYEKYNIANDLELENDDNGNNFNLSIPNIGGQIPSIATAFDDFALEDDISFMVNGAHDDFDASIPVCSKNIRQDSPLMLAVLDNDKNLVEKILKNEISDVNYHNKDGQTALHYAALHGFYSLAKILLQSNAQVDCKDHLNRTPLHVASQSDNVQVAQLLIDGGAQLTNTDNDDKTPRDYAQSEKMIAILSF